MFRFRLNTKFLVLVLGSLILFLGVLSYVFVLRDAALLQQKAEEKQHVLALAIYSDLKESMIEGTPRSTLKLMDSLRGMHGLVRLETLRRDGSRAFGIKGNNVEIPELARVFETGNEVSFREKGRPLLHTILYPLKNERGCVRCHRNQDDILGVLLISLSMEDSVSEVAASKRKLTFFLAGLILVIGGVLYFLVRKLVLQPLAVLHDGAERIGRGELRHRINLSTNDEIEELAQSLNEMAGRLEASYEGLEYRIKERTKEVEDKAKQLYEYSRDLATISRVSIKVFNAEQSLDQMLDRFMWAVGRGLRYSKAVICLIDPKRALLEIKRDSGAGSFLRIPDQPLSGTGPFAALVRSGRELFVPDVSQDRVFSRYQQAGSPDRTGLHVIPILTGTHEKLCWQEKNCDRSDCPAYKRESEKCWLVSNTCCGNPLIESYGDKLAYCMSCEVFPVLGILIVAVPADKGFRRRDVSVLRILAAEMGAALENHRLHDHNRRLLKELLELHKVTAAALVDPSLDRALKAFTDSALKFSGLDACNFWLLSADAREFKHGAGASLRDEDQSVAPSVLPADQGILGRALSQNQVLAEYNISANDTTEPGRTAASCGHTAILALPLKTEQRTLGVFTVHKKAATPFLETEIAAFMLLANHATMAINVCVLNEELKNQNRELARSTSLMGGMLASMSSGVMLLDANGTVQLINHAGAEILHLKAREVMNRPITGLIPDVSAFLKWPPVSYQEIEICGPDGSVIPLGYSTADFLGQSSTREGTIVVFRDLTEIKALRAEVLNKERFAAMGQVVAGVAHEIRNPLFGISSIGQIFERELKKPEHRELAVALLSETKRLNHLVEELLIYARPVKLSLTWCELAELWREVINMQREELAQKGMTVEPDFGMSPLPPAFLDQNQIRQVFLNLIRNAVDATARGGKIVIRLLLEDEHIIFKVCDNGVGIPIENIDKVFDLFFSTKPKGTGLGLAICKKIVEDHGGMICVESRVRQGGRGTTVTVKLPYRRAAKSSK